MSAANSPIDPLYWFKNVPPNILVAVKEESGSIMRIDQMDKWRFVSQEAQDGMFLCEIVGNARCGLRFFLPEAATAAAERVAD
jgi:hypothetical protein